MLTDMQIPIVPVSDGTTQRLIANIQENTVANQNYYKGDQFILNGVLYMVTKSGSPAIAQGATINIASDCEVSDTITQQLKPKTLVNRVLEDITVSNGRMDFPSGRNVISATITVSNTYCPLIFIPISATQDRAYLYVDRTITENPLKAFTDGTTYRVDYKYIPSSF